MKITPLPPAKRVFRCAQNHETPVLNASYRPRVCVVCGCSLEEEAVDDNLKFMAVVDRLLPPEELENVTVGNVRQWAMDHGATVVIDELEEEG